MQLTTLCYIKRGNRYLMLHRVKKQNDLNKDKWIGVGGHIENGESPEQCVTREIAEETGLTVQGLELRGYITFVSGEQCEGMFLFTANSPQGDVKACDEGELTWVEQRDIQSLALWQGDKLFLQRMAKPGFFTLRLEYNGNRLIKHELHDY